jgi:hypothetical protein
MNDAKPKCHKSPKHIEPLWRARKIRHTPPIVSKRQLNRSILIYAVQNAEYFVFYIVASVAILVDIVILTIVYSSVAIKTKRDATQIGKLCDPAEAVTPDVVQLNAI